MVKRSRQWNNEDESDFVKRMWQNHQDLFAQLKQIDKKVWAVLCFSFGLGSCPCLKNKNISTKLGITQRQVHFYKKVGCCFLGYQAQFYNDVSQKVARMNVGWQKKQKGERKMEKQKEILMWFRENTGADLGEKLTYFSDAFLQATTRDLILFPVVEKFMRDMAPAKIASDFNLTESGVEDIIFVSCLLLGWNGQPSNGSLKLFEEIKKLQIARAVVAADIAAIPATIPKEPQAVKPKLDITKFYFQLWHDIFDWLLAQESPVIRENGVVFVGPYMNILRDLISQRYPAIASKKDRGFNDRWVQLVETGVVKPTAKIKGRRAYLILDPNQFEVVQKDDSPRLQEWFGAQAAVSKIVAEKPKPKAKSTPRAAEKEFAKAISEPSLAAIFSATSDSLPILRQELQKLDSDIDSLEQMLAETRSRAQDLETFLKLREEESKLAEKLQSKK